MSRRIPWSPSHARAGATPIPTNKRIPAIARFISLSSDPVAGSREETRSARGSFARKCAEGDQVVGNLWNAGNTGEEILYRHVVIALLVRAFHFFFDPLGQLFDFFRFLDDVEGEHVFVGLIDAGLEFDGKLEQSVGVRFDGGNALLRSLLLHVMADAVAGRVFIERRVDVVPRQRARSRILGQAGYSEQRE